jgi:hypothetical protein
MYNMTTYNVNWGGGELNITLSLGIRADIKTQN